MLAKVFVERFEDLRLPLRHHALQRLELLLAPGKAHRLLGLECCLEIRKHRCEIGG